MKSLKITALAVALLGLAALVPSGSERVSAQGRGRELTILSGRGGELGVRIVDAASGGVEIDDVQPDSAAEKAGLKRGDVIVEFDGERVRSGRQFARLVQETPAGRTVKATIMRDGKRQDVQVTPTEGSSSGSALFLDKFGPGIEAYRGRAFGPDLDHLRDLPFLFDNFNRFDFPTMMPSGRLGVDVEPLTTQLGQYFGAKDGVLVRAVTDGSAASKAGIKAGDVITSVNGTTI